MPTARGSTGEWRLRWALALGFGLAGVALNAFPVEILSGVNLLFGHVAVIAAAVFLGPWAGALAGAVAGSITPLLFGHPWVWVIFTCEGAVVGFGVRRLLPLVAVGGFWAVAALPYYLLLHLFYPSGTATTIVVKTVVESGLAALVLQVLVLAPRLHRAVRGWLPPPLREVRTQTVVRSVVLVAALIPLVVLSASEARLLYRLRVSELDRANRAAALALGAGIDRRIAELRASLAEAARAIEESPRRPRRALAQSLFQSPLAHEAAVVEGGRVRLVVGVPREDGATLRSLERLPTGPPLRVVAGAHGAQPWLLVVAPTATGELVASIDPGHFGHLQTIPEPESTRLLILDDEGRALADTAPGPIDLRLRAAIERATRAGISTYLPDPETPRTLRPQATLRLAVARVESLDLRVVVARRQRSIQGAVEDEGLVVLGGLGLAVLVVFAAGVALTKVIVEPVRAVSLAASGLEAGHRATRVESGAGDAPLELRQLAEGFDRMAEELERQLRAIESASRAKDEFLSVASHELKTPLTILKAQVQLLERRAAEGQATQLRMIDRQLDRITRLVSQLLDASAVGAGVISLDPRELELSEVVRRVALGLADSAPGHELHLDLVPVHGRWDELRLEQVLHNLIGNAIKYSPAGGPIDVSLRDRGGGGAVIRIADRGIGIGNGQQEGLFERFSRGRGRTTTIGGFGVGLYVVREIVERHGGTVELEPREGGGTVATVRLPAEPPPAAARGSAEPPDARGAPA